MNEIIYEWLGKIDTLRKRFDDLSPNQIKRELANLQGKMGEFTKKNWRIMNMENEMKVNKKAVFRYNSKEFKVTKTDEDNIMLEVDGKLIYVTKNNEIPYAVAQTLDRLPTPTMVNIFASVNYAGDLYFCEKIHLEDSEYIEEVLNGE